MCECRRVYETSSSSVLVCQAKTASNRIIVVYTLKVTRFLLHLQGICTRYLLRSALQIVLALLTHVVRPYKRSLRFGRSLDYANHNDLARCCLEYPRRYDSSPQCHHSHVCPSAYPKSNCVCCPCVERVRKTVTYSNW